MTMIKMGVIADIHTHIHTYIYVDTDSFNSSNALVDIKDGASLCCVKVHHASHLQ